MSDFLRLCFVRPSTQAYLLSIALASTPGVSAEGELVDFNRDILSIFASHCLDCHGPDANARESSLRFDRPENVYVDRGGYRVIDREHPEESELLKRLTSDDPELRMPPLDAPQERLSPDQVDLLRQWISQGGEWASHWAFLPPVELDLPDVEDASWPRNGLDHFVLARLDREGLEPASPANRVTLLRRVTLALTGLPPTLQEVDAFLADQSPDAYGKVVDRLLGSPRYGVNMSLAWLDAARYSDSSGYQADWERYQWPWRDWVVNAYNANMPFDQFTIEQLAGDLLPKATLSQRIATGFNRNHRINDEGGSLDAEFEVEYVVDRVDTTATVWLGLSAGCARCHDHKYDPLSQKEFYRLYAFFDNVPEKGIDGRKGAAKPFIEIPNEWAKSKLESRKTELEEREDRLREPQEKNESPAREEVEDEIKALKKEIRWLERNQKGMAMVMLEKPEREPTYLLRRGDYRHPDKSEVLSPALPRIFGSLPEGTAHDRLALARWIVSPQNPLTARVTVNRLWQHHFGTGLVRTSEDFGTRGERPSHPALLDWLATEFVRQKWDLKAMHRLIVTSSAFRQSSHVSETLLRRDPANRLIARGPRLRLSGVAIRDQALFVSGLGSELMGGPSVKPYQPAGLWGEVSFGTGKTTIDFYEQDYGESLYRRSLYTFWKRTVAPTRLSIFDGGGREMCRVRGEVTNTPMQALTLQNDVTFVEAARRLAERMMKEGGDTLRRRIAYGWRLALSRPPENDELATLVRTFDRNLALYRESEAEAVRLLGNGESERDDSLPAAEHAAYTIVALTILNLDETITLE